MILFSSRCILGYFLSFRKMKFGDLGFGEMGLNRNYTGNIIYETGQ